MSELLLEADEVKLVLDTEPVFEPLLDQHRYKGAYGGRGSGKSHFFAECAIEDCLRWPSIAGEGMRFLSFREIQKSLKESAKHLLESKIAEMGFGEEDGFKVFTDRIQTPGDGVIAFTGMQDHTADSVKSYEGFHRAWGEEAHTISAKSLGLLRPTIRWEDKQRGLISELWFSWNPRRKIDAVDAMFRSGNPPTDAVSVMVNWNNNSLFPSVLEQERRDCLLNNPEEYDHIWNGGYAKVASGAYFARNLNDARSQGRIGRVAADPLMERRAYWDIGGTGAKADARAIWIVQFVGKEIRVLHYRETSGQPLSADVDWLRSSGFAGIACVLPHDGETNDRVHDVSYESYLRKAGFPVVVIPNQGKGAATKRIEATRRILGACWFNEETTSDGLDALGWYHEKKDEERNMGLGPEHDWASHGADAFGLMAVAYEAHSAKLPQAPKFTPRAVV